MIKRLLHSKIVKNASWIVAGKVIQMVISFLVSLLTVRYLGPGNYGLINYGTAYTLFFTSVCTLGINSVIVKEFIDAPNQEGKIIGTALGLRAVSSLLSVLIIVGISFVLDADEPLTRLVVALCSLGVVFNIFETFNYWFQSRLESKKTAIASLIAYSAMAVYKVFLLITQKPVAYFSLATSVDYLFVAIVLFIFYQCDHGAPLSFSWTYGKALLKKSYHYILPGLMVSIYGQTDKVMLKHMVDEAETGFYSTATVICGLWGFIIYAIIDSMTPPIMEAHQNNHQKFNRLNRLLYCIIFYVCAFVSLIFTIFGEQLIGILYGAEYLPAALPLKIVTWYTAFSYLGGARNAWVVCENAQKYLKFIYSAAAVCNVLLNYILIPFYGAAGAAIASLATQIITIIIIPFFIRGMRENSIMMVEAIFFRGLK